MKTILHIICSPRGQASESRRLSQTLIDHLLRQSPDALVVTRLLGGVAMPPVDEDYAISQQATADVSQAGSMAFSETLVAELESADIVVIATPMHNFTVPFALKAWIDHVVRVRRTFNVSPTGKIPLLRDRPVYVAIASGGRFSEDGTRQPDFLTPYLKAILATIGLHDLAFFSVQGTAFGPDTLTKARSETCKVIERHFNHN